MAITLTERAANHVRDHIAKRGAGVGLRLGVRTVGCSGKAYKLDFVDDVNDNDILFESAGITIFVDKDSLNYVDGTELDYVRDGLNEGFEFNNPNVKSKCGCGESFSV